MVLSMHRFLNAKIMNILKMRFEAGLNLRTYLLWNNILWQLQVFFPSSLLRILLVLAYFQILWPKLTHQNITIYISTNELDVSAHVVCDWNTKFFLMGFVRKVNRTRTPSHCTCAFRYELRKNYPKEGL